MKAKLVPYLGFDGNAREAMEFYHTVLGGELKLQTVGEAQPNTKPEEKDNIMHADLSNGDLSFFASDGNAQNQVEMGNNISMSIVGDDEQLLTKYFNGLAEGGKVDLPLAKQIWGDVFGMLTDKFGVHWMVNINSNQPQ